MLLGKSGVNYKGGRKPTFYETQAIVFQSYHVPPFLYATLIVISLYLSILNTTVF